MSIKNLLSGVNLDESSENIVNKIRKNNQCTEDTSFIFEDIDDSLDLKMIDLRDLLRFTHKARDKALQGIYQKELEVKQKMFKGDQEAKILYDDLQFEKHQMSEDFKDLVEKIANALSSEQLAALLKKAGIEY